MFSFILIGIAITFFIFTLIDTEWFPVFFVSSILAGLTIAIFYYYQLNYWVDYHTIDSKIVNAEQVRDSLAKKIDDLHIEYPTLMNGDTPYASTINQFVQAEQEVLKLRQEKVDIINSLIKGEEGFNGYWCKLARPEGIDIGLRKVQ